VKELTEESVHTRYPRISKLYVDAPLDQTIMPTSFRFAFPSRSGNLHFTRCGCVSTWQPVFGSI
ncbi:MAG: hypothetical protein QGG71_08710, partial [Pirellulaceae bacterium]|nr:hypothetical protein [Pirellulaceae bacterium]